MTVIIITITRKIWFWLGLIACMITSGNFSGITVFELSCCIRATNSLTTARSPSAISRLERDSPSSQAIQARLRPRCEIE